MKIGCHAVLFTDAIAKDTVNVLTSLRAAGAEGVEIGARFFGLEKSGELRAALEETGMELSGLHVVAGLTALLDDPGKVEKPLEDAARFLQELPGKNIIVTGGIPPETMNAPNLGDDRLTESTHARTIAENLNTIAARLKAEYGVQLHYHNHNWEFKNGAVLFRALAEHAPDLCFGLDTGWAAVGGYDPVALIRGMCKGRVRYVHLRDYRREDAARCATFDELQEGYAALGEGDMDYRALLGAVGEAMGDDGWAVVEYEKGAVDAQRYARAVAYVRGVLADLHGAGEA